MKNFEKEKLRRELREGVLRQEEEDLYLANAGLDDYLMIIDREED